MESADPRICAGARSLLANVQATQLSKNTIFANTSTHNNCAIANDATASFAAHTENEQKHTSIQDPTSHGGEHGSSMQCAGYSAPVLLSSPEPRPASLMRHDARVFRPCSPSMLHSPGSLGSDVWDEECDGNLDDVYSLEDAHDDEAAHNQEDGLQKTDREIQELDDDVRLLSSPQWKPAASPGWSITEMSLPGPIAFKPWQVQRKPKRSHTEMLQDYREADETLSMRKVAKTIKRDNIVQRLEERAQSPSDRLLFPRNPKRSYTITIDLTEDDNDSPAASKKIASTAELTRGWQSFFSTSLFSPQSLSPAAEPLLSSSKRKRSHSATVNQDGDADAPVVSSKVAKTTAATSSQQSFFSTSHFTLVEDPSFRDFIDLTEESTASPPRKLKRSNSDAIDSIEAERATSISRKVAKTTEGTREVHSYFPTPRFSPATEISLSDVIDLTASEHSNRSRETNHFYQAPRESYLHRLPAELRNCIYRYVGHKTARVDLPSLDEPALAKAFPDLKDEISSIVFLKNKFRIPVYSEYRINYKDDPLPKDPVEKEKAKQKPIKVSPNNSGFEVGTLALEYDHWLHTIDPLFQVIRHIGFRVMESHALASGAHRHICDYFLNVRMDQGKTVVTHTKKMMVDHHKKSKFKPMCDFALEKAKKMVQKEGFVGFDWEQLQELAACFVSVKDAKSRIYRRWGRAKLKEEGGEMSSDGRS